MARIKSTTFQGAPMVDVDVDAPTFTRVILNAIGDTALAYDRATGSNGEASTMIHDGAGRGALMGVPLCNQYLGANLDLSPGTGVDGGKHSSDGATYLAAAPMFVPLGESTQVVEVQTAFARGVDVVVLTTAGAEVARVALGPGPLRRATLSGLTTGERILVLETTTNVADVDNGSLHSISINPGRQRSGPGSPPARNTDNVIGVTSSGAAALAWRDLDDAFVVSAGSLNAMHLAVANRNQNGLLEYLTGWPAGDDLNYAQVDSATTNPTRSEFVAHARAGFASEPLVEFPLLMCFLGAGKVDGWFVVNALQPPTLGMLGWYAPWPLTGATLPVDVARQSVRLPDFAPADYDLHVAVIALRGPSFAGTWSIDVDVGAGIGAANFAAVTGTQLLRAKTTLSTWTQDTTNQINIGITRTAGARAVDEIAILGYALWFTPK